MFSFTKYSFGPKEKEEREIKIFKRGDGRSYLFPLHRF